MSPEIDELRGNVTEGYISVGRRLRGAEPGVRQGAVAGILTSIEIHADLSFPSRDDSQKQILAPDRFQLRKAFDNRTADQSSPLRNRILHGLAVHAKLRHDFRGRGRPIQTTAGVWCAIPIHPLEVLDGVQRFQTAPEHGIIQMKAHGHARFQRDVKSRRNHRADLVVGMVERQGADDKRELPVCGIFDANLLPKPTDRLAQVFGRGREVRSQFMRRGPASEYLEGKVAHLGMQLFLGD